MNKTNLVAELQWRGLLHDIMPGTEELLLKEMTTGYVGFDPTADSLHIGNLVPIMLLVHWQRAGHKPLALVGGATGLVGDPTGRSTERNMLTVDEINHNLNCQRKQLEKFLDFDANLPNRAEIVNNYDWFKEFDFLGFIRDVGKHIPINYMLAKDSVKNRLENGMSFTEFCYQLIQGYDFVHLYNNYGCKLQMGGSDQWGNITTGTEMIRRMQGGEAFALTAPLVKKSDGTKFGKSEGGNVWLDPEKTSPYQFYQFWLNVSDEDAARYIGVYTLLEKEQIEQLKREHAEAPHLRILQKALAEEVTVRVHSRDDYEQAVQASEILFGRATAENLQALPEKLLLQIMEGVPQSRVARDLFDAGVELVSLLAEQTSIFPSRGEARKMIQAGGFSLNKTKISEEKALIGKQDLLANKYLLAQKGKKQYFLIVAE
ncbi:MAG: tyrosine--tRNA ligase [Bacteroidia bacterium]